MSIAIPLVSTPGINRDGTIFSGSTFLELEHARFLLNGQPLKRGGIQQIWQGDGQIAHKIAIFLNVNNTYDVFIGKQGTGTKNNPANAIQYFQLTADGALLPNTYKDVTPNDQSYDPTIPNMVWNFQLMSDSGGQPNVLAHAAPNLDGNYLYQPYDLYSTLLNNVSTFQKVTNSTTQQPVTASGGFCVSDPYLFLLGQGVTWSASNDFTKYPDSPAPGSYRNPSSEPIIAAHSTRNGTGQTLFWTFSRLYMGAFQGISGENSDLALFQFQEIDRNISILSPRCIVRYGQRFIWPGNDEFYMFDGTVQPMKNVDNKEWFFENIDMDFAGKVWGYTVPKYYEVCFPFVKKGDGATECNHELVYNFAQQRWFDRPFKFSCGTTESVYGIPLAMSSEVQHAHQQVYGLYQLETGLNRQDINTAPLPIRSIIQYGYQKTNPISLRNMDIQRLELDMIQEGDVTLEVWGIPYASSYPTLLKTIEIKDTGNVKGSQRFVYINVQTRYPSFKFISNAVDGFMQFGNSVMIVDVGDEQPAPSPQSL